MINAIFDEKVYMSYNAQRRTAATDSHILDWPYECVLLKYLRFISMQITHSFVAAHMTDEFG